MMWRGMTYVVTVFDADAGKVYKHHHDTKNEADDEIREAKRWGFVAWVTPARKESIVGMERDEAPA
jgi:hypothetical protein